MQKNMRNKLFPTLMLAMALSATASFALADNSVHQAEATKGRYAATLSNIGIEQPWSRAMPPTAHTGAVFLSIHNQGQADKLISAFSPIAEKTELHNHIQQNGLMKMVEVEFIDLPAQTSFELKPGSYHIMLIGLKQPLIEGELFPIRLDFANSGSVELQAEVKSMHAGSAHMH